MAKIRRRREQDNTPGVAGKVEDNPQQAHPSDQTADLEGIDQNDNVDKKPTDAGGFTPEGAETAEPMYEQMEGDDYLENILAKLEELERRLADLEGGAEPEMGEEMMPMEEQADDEEFEDEVDDEEMIRAERRKRIERRAQKVFAPKRRIERRMTRRISTVPMGSSSHSKKSNLKEFLGEVRSDTRRL